MSRTNGSPREWRTSFGAPATRPESLADRAEFLTGGLVPIQCHRCGTEVLVKKNSLKHTSIQWTTSPASTCPIFAAQADSGSRTALLDSCPELTESIARAVADGQIRVGAGD
ncbi:hypothetical protein ONR57_08675 [Hoyosella sp. YIM 151337]|uniref:hypothetical protein n=1 Tax=Hoyosella sp. YIM 151337 TaxID=2992742 RepID=UPI002235A03C|nr:hypothetical protein [Hoyosella sp. YIM 151337]MCW4353369.1 hypothetical protein [Hoyosella sp. YIM 151337]